MDQTLIDLVGSNKEPLQLLDDPAGKVRLPDGAEYALKPLKELYGQGENTSSIDTRNERHLRLLMAIEAPILEEDHRERGLTDGTVLLAVERLATSPDADPQGDRIIAAVQRSLRALLSLHDYNRQELRLAARRIVKSIQLHGKHGSRRAYLDVIHGHVPHRH